mgnify:CR=1 FL=1
MTARTARDRVHRALPRDLRATAHTEVEKRKRETLLTVLLAVAVFVITSAVGLAIYFFLL